MRPEDFPTADYMHEEENDIPDALINDPDFFDFPMGDEDVGFNLPQPPEQHTNTTTTTGKDQSESIPAPVDPDDSTLQQESKKRGVPDQTTPLEVKPKRPKLIRRRKSVDDAPSSTTTNTDLTVNLLDDILSSAEGLSSSIPVPPVHSTSTHHDSYSFQAAPPTININSLEEARDRKTQSLAARGLQRDEEASAHRQSLLGARMESGDLRRISDWKTDDVTRFQRSNQRFTKSLQQGQHGLNSGLSSTHLLPQRHPSTDLSSWAGGWLDNDNINLDDRRLSSLPVILDPLRSNFTKNILAPLFSKLPMPAGLVTPVGQSAGFNQLHLKPPRDSDFTRIMLDDNVERFVKRNHTGPTPNITVFDQTVNLLSEPYPEVLRKAQQLLCDPLGDLKASNNLNREAIDASRQASIAGLWSERYRAKRYSELLTSEGSVNRVAVEWLNQVATWNECQTQSGRLQTKRPQTRPHSLLLLSGPPGVGKTTVAHCVAKQLQFYVIEINASDDRRESEWKDAMQAASRGARGSESALLNMRKGKKNSRGSVIVLDEVDGADRRALQMLEKEIKSRLTKSELILPLIAICNEPWTPKLQELRSLSKHIPVGQVDASRLQERLGEVLEKEGFRASRSHLERLSKAFCVDVRRLLNGVQQALTISLFEEGTDGPNGGAKLGEPAIRRIESFCSQIDASEHENELVRRIMTSHDSDNPIIADSRDAKIVLVDRISSTITSNRDGFLSTIIQNLCDEPNLILESSSRALGLVSHAFATAGAHRRSGYTSRDSMELALLAFLYTLKRLRNDRSLSSSSCPPKRRIEVLYSRCLPYEASKVRDHVRQQLRTLSTGTSRLKGGSSNLSLPQRDEHVASLVRRYLPLGVHGHDGLILTVLGECLRHPAGMFSYESWHGPLSVPLYRDYRKYLLRLFSSTSSYQPTSQRGADRQAMLYLNKMGPPGVATLPLGFIPRRFRAYHRWSTLADFFGFGFSDAPLPNAWKAVRGSNKVKNEAPREGVFYLNPPIHRLNSLHLSARHRQPESSSLSAANTIMTLPSMKDKAWRHNPLAGADKLSRTEKAWLCRVINHTNTSSTFLPYLPLFSLEIYKAAIALASLPRSAGLEGIENIQPSDHSKTQGMIRNTGNSTRPLEPYIRSLAESGIPLIGMGAAADELEMSSVFTPELVEVIRTSWYHPVSQRFKDAISESIRLPHHLLSNPSLDTTDPDMDDHPVIGDSHHPSMGTIRTLPSQNAWKPSSVMIDQLRNLRKSMQSTDAMMDRNNRASIVERLKSRVYCQRFDGSTKAVSALVKMKDLM